VCLWRPADAEPCGPRLASAGYRPGLVPAGLAARDTLRLDGRHGRSHGNELGPGRDAYGAGLGRVVKFDKPDVFVVVPRRSPIWAQSRPFRVLAVSRSFVVPGAASRLHVLADVAACGKRDDGATVADARVPIAMAYWTRPSLDTARTGR